jgi:hypothetical protein
MVLLPEATLDPSTQTAIADAYGLGEPVDAIFVARGAMGAVNRMRTHLHGALRHWTVKRSYWNRYTEHEIATEVDFTSQCESVGVHAPRSIQRVDGGGYVLTVDDHPNAGTQYRVLEWVEGEVGRSDDPRTIPPIAEWMARIHNLAVDPAGQPIDEWFVRVTYDWDDLAGRLVRRAPDVADQLRTRRADIRELTDFVNATQESDAVWCHADIGASNLVWGHGGPLLIDWENAGPLVPHQELGLRVRSLGPSGKSAYHAYREAGGPGEITAVTHLASSVAVHLNYVGCQAELLLNDDYIEQHEFARAQVGGAAQSLPSLHSLEEWIEELSA